MFETAELGQKVSKKDFDKREEELRLSLLMAQQRLRKAPFPVIVVFAGVDGAGKGTTVNLLNEWMDPRWVVTRYMGEPTPEEKERPPYWRYWRDQPPKGLIGFFLSSWYSKPLIDRAYGKSKVNELESDLEDIVNFEKTLADDGALVLKFWMHLGKKAQKKRLSKLEKDPLESWRVTERDWKHYRMYDNFVDAAERIIMRTSTGAAPWHLVEGVDHEYRSLRVGEILLEALEERLGAHERREKFLKESPPSEPPSSHLTTSVGKSATTVLDAVDLSQTIEHGVYKLRLKEQRARLNELHREARDKKVGVVLAFEGWDAGGKGGAIRRLTSALDARSVRVIPIAAPTDEERAQHYLWRFWRHMGRVGRVVIFDRSWYGRVLVERVENFARREEWGRAYAEINHFEKQLVDHGIVVCKFWVHIDQDEQARRFEERAKIPYKSWKLTDEDWRNRERWDDYVLSVHDMVERTSTQIAPWTIVPGNDKKFARIKVIETVCDNIEAALKKKRK